MPGNGFDGDVVSVLRPRPGGDFYGYIDPDGNDFTTSSDYAFEDKAQARDFFTRLTGLFKNFNYAAEGSSEYIQLQAEIDGMVEKQFKV